MTARVEFLFSYGTLRQANVQQETFGRLLDGTADALVGFKEEMVRITDPAVLATSGRLFHPVVVRSGNAHDRVTGTVFHISAEELAAADAYEVSDYKRAEAQLASGPKAWVYVKRA